YSFDLSPNLSPTRREASSLAPLPLQGRGWGLGLYWTQPKTAIVVSINFHSASKHRGHYHNLFLI
ncbi:MAG: hypothetical protein WBA39_22895, partial [Rivularia sp. (in: cyanobacteria)]